MKYTILLFLSISTFANSATICNTSLGEIHYSENRPSLFEVVYESNEQLDRKLFESLPQINEMSYEECSMHISTETVRDIETGKEFTLYYSNEDHCDGGNSYGSFVDENGKVAGEIHDGDFYCL